MKSGKKNEYASFGKVAGEEEREAAGKVLAQSLEARAAANWGGQCATLTPTLLKGMATTPGISGATECPKFLKKIAEPLAKTQTARTNTLNGSISVLRVKGDKAYALYHGTNNTNYAMPMQLVGGQWKVASLQENKIP